jgi:hypothetical protein
MDGGAETTEATETTFSFGSALAASFASPTTGAANGATGAGSIG